MSLDKEYLRSKVVQGIKQMPYEVDIYRIKVNNYGEEDGYTKITSLTGVLYSASNYKNINISLQDKGEVSSRSEKKFLVDYNDKSILVKKGDFIIYKNNCYKVLDQGEEFEIFFDMQVKENEWIKI